MIRNNVENPGREDLMSTLGESVNQHLARQPAEEEIGRALVPQESGLPGVNAYASVLSQGPQAVDSVQDNMALVGPLLGP